jgi:hypothetical protein
MGLPATPTEALHRYSICLSSQTYADSPRDALEMFFAQFSTGNVGVTIHDSDANEEHDLDEMGDESAEAQVDLALTLIRRHAAKLSSHTKLSVLRQVQEAVT